GNVLLLALRYERLSTGCNLLGLWAFDGYRYNPTPWQQLLFLQRIMSWNINMRLLFSSSRSFAVANGKSIFPTFTMKQRMLQTIWLISAILSLLGCIFFILQIRVCPTSYITIL
ncbi:hypothetical protein LINGRAHAP2_LOCUS7223, partial [Linum grandiflorum]